MKVILYTSLVLLLATTACSSSDDPTKDQQAPVIEYDGQTSNPLDCQVYRRGDVIPFNYTFTDNEALGSFNIEIHNDFDHHTHSTSIAECPLDAKKSPVHPWVYNKDYPIPGGEKHYTARIDIPIPTDIDEGDYHFMIRVTDAASWQQIRGVTIKIKGN